MTSEAWIAEASGIAVKEIELISLIPAPPAR